MKKLIALLLMLTMVVSMAACSPKNKDVTPTVDAATVGGKLWAAFTAAQSDKAPATALDMANALAADPAIELIGCMAMEVKQGLLTGFDNYEVKGFETGAMFAPMISTQPFVGYIFDLAEGADVAAFIKELQDNCNPRWNVCTEAEQTVAGSKGSRVFFVMCPNTIEE